MTIANATAQPFLKIRTSSIDKIMFRSVRFNPWLAPNDVMHHMEKIATALTNAGRSDAASRGYIAGQAFAPETYLHVNWA
jgi:hypothetical protein